ncbi:Succinate dehydrogenase [ubiquinone] cytochrome b small subunit, mitochondrial [Choanephora cucurbitarum]|uniref:Succinate dehydrogenase [ubiquinone] cytochrome b small subunit n=1 Tax=Choanephora cucurbitarum TaxID=101091 RepID=A0A1C7N7B8_9FUNG|nr:Succinate dehydrogenase [ubiquinone] cytochrome b small subunit, mitochondrial [Choanephora cucurbitarum]
MALRLFSRSVSSAHLYRSQVKLNPIVLRSYSAAASATNASLQNTTTKSDSATTTKTTTENEEKKTELEATEENAEKETIKKETKEHGYEFGAHHWNLERASAVALIPMFSTSLIYGAHPISDGLLGVVLPYHIYMGFDSCITDYIPKRVYPRLHRASNWANAVSTNLVMWGCYEFNTNDIGITEFMQRLFAA